MKNSKALIIVISALLSFNFAYCLSLKETASAALTEASKDDATLKSTATAAKTSAAESAKTEAATYTNPTVQKLMDAAADIPANATDITSGKVTVEKSETILEKLKKTSLEGAPEDLKTGYNEVVKSYEKVTTLAKKLPAKEAVTTKKGLGSALSSALASDDATAPLTEYKTAFTELNDSRKKLAEIAKKYKTK